MSAHEQPGPGPQDVDCLAEAPPNGKRGPASGHRYPSKFGHNPLKGGRGNVQVGQAEKERAEFATKELEALGCRVRDNGGCLRVTLLDGRRFDFYPWKGWFQGVGNPGSGRGIMKLLALAKVAK